MQDPELEAALEEQQNLVESSLPAVFEAYDAAIAEKISQPVVMVIDCLDEFGGQIAAAWVGDEAVEEAIAERDPDDDTVVFAAAFAWEDCRREVPEFFPYLKPVFDQDPPSDGVLVIGVTSGGASALTAPFDARPE
ncbi:hypothetical protein KOR34_34900 [Posidoniimonas corsicana]|uniref:Uncharacterized protein n=1 Tax=Posidoniimonas corsicana TaxID=1938618 RepID=A0A5C5V770_9BACT|nr:hypothetical protein [Posidoniimonas corsicana]TWT33657.1 hypothetical protein KOR34_34900 [Posidoniimonas corsicana]